MLAIDFKTWRCSDEKAQVHKGLQDSKTTVSRRQLGKARSREKREAGR